MLVPYIFFISTICVRRKAPKVPSDELKMGLLFNDWASQNFVFKCKLLNIMSSRKISKIT